MTQLVPRRAVGTSRLSSIAVFAIVTLAATAAAFTFGYDLWRFLVSAVLIVVLVALVTLLVLLLPGAFGWGEK